MALNQILIWKTATHGEVGYSGKISLFTIAHDDCCPPPGKPWKLKTMLPGIKPYLNHFVTIEDAKFYAEEVWAEWLKTANLKNGIQDAL